MDALSGDGQALRPLKAVDFAYDRRRELQAQILYADIRSTMRKGVFGSLLLAALPTGVALARHGHGPLRLGATFLGTSMALFSGYFLFMERIYAGMDRQINLENSKRLNQAMDLKHPALNQ